MHRMPVAVVPDVKPGHGPMRVLSFPSPSGWRDQMTAFIGRREFITLFGGAAVAWPLAAEGQQTERVRRSRFLGAATSSVGAPWLSALVQRFGELGWLEGRNLQIDVRWAEGRNDRATEIAVEFARADLDLIVTWATGPALAAKRAASRVPIVFALATDPVGSGLVVGLARARAMPPACRPSISIW